MEQEEAGAVTAMTPYSRFNLTNFLQDDDMMHEIFVNYEKETEVLFRAFARHFNRATGLKSNKIIAVIGQAGSGKTSFAMSFINKLGKYSEGLSSMKNVNFMLGLSGKMGDSRHLRDALPMRGKSGVVFFDDMHTAFYPTGKDEDKLSKAHILRNLSAQVEQCFIITTWNVFGWKYALTIVPDLLRQFDEIIWLDGLDSKNMEYMIRKRARKRCLNEESFDFDNIFDKNGLKLVDTAAINNPRLYIYLIHRAILAAHKANTVKISEEIFKKVIEEMNIDVDVDKILNNRVAYYLLNSPSNTIKDLIKFLNIDRSTIQKKLQELQKNKIIRVHEHKEEEIVEKGIYYTLNQMIQVKMEKKLCEEVKTSIHKYLYDKKMEVTKM
ncbi:hypothetical protein HYX05_04170 [Candidatus Woesearchaeota archaeon]|nr:hypothetical protein [Candidatus Woesearchaeota archaeon]